jgi:hypothetical protein
MKLPRGKPKVTLNFEDKGGISVLSGHFLSGFGIFGPTRRDSAPKFQSKNPTIVIIGSYYTEDFDVRFAQTTNAI